MGEIKESELSEVQLYGLYVELKMRIYGGNIMGQIANQMALELFFKIKGKIKEKKKEKKEKTIQKDTKYSKLNKSEEVI